MDSQSYKNQLKESLQEIIYSVDEVYYSIRDELEKEILHRKETIEKSNKETEEIYYQLTDELCEKLIKEHLPFRIKLFNKIRCIGKAVKEYDTIKLYFKLNNQHNHHIERSFNIDQIKYSKTWKNR